MKPLTSRALDALNQIISSITKLIRQVWYSLRCRHPFRPGDRVTVGFNDPGLYWYFAFVPDKPYTVTGVGTTYCKVTNDDGEQYLFLPRELRLFQNPYVYDVSEWTID